MPTVLPRLAGVALVGGLTIGIANPALADDTESAEHAIPIDAIKERCDNAIERRLTDLDRAEARLDEVDALTDEHAATLAGIIGATESGLTELQSAIAAATERAEVRELCGQIAPDYRVYLVVLPQAHLTVGADRVDLAVARADELVFAFDAAVATAEAAGADVTEAVAHRDAAVGHVRTADESAAGVADSVLVVTPDSYNAGPGAAALDSARSALRTSHSELHAAHADAHAAARALREALADLDPT